MRIEIIKKIKEYLYQPGNPQIYVNYLKYVDYHICKNTSWTKWYIRNQHLSIDREPNISYWIEERKRCLKKLSDSVVWYQLLK